MAILAGARGQLEHCTVHGNFGPVGAAAGIELTSASLRCYSTAISDNRATDTSLRNFGADSLANFAVQFDSQGYNFTESAGALLNAAFDGPGDFLGTNSGIGGLRHLGGWSCVHPVINDGQQTSPLYNAGDPAPFLMPCADGRGYLRIAGGRMDIGAFEFDGRQQDSDGDQMPDWWERRWGFDIDDAGDADDDPDLDGDDNLTEFQNRTVPISAPPAALSPLEVIAFLPAANGSSIELTFTSDPGVAYEIWRSIDLENWVLFGSVTGAANASETTITGLPFGTRGFFRVDRPDG